MPAPLIPAPITMTSNWPLEFSLAISVLRHLEKDCDSQVVVKVGKDLGPSIWSALTCQRFGRLRLVAAFAH